MKYIESKVNKWCKHVQQLRQKKYRQQYSAYLAEGMRAIEDMLPTGLVSHLFIRESISLQQDIGILIERAMNQQIIVFIVADDAFTTMTATIHDQGIVAIVKKKKYELSSFSSTNGMYLLLDSVQDPGNLGTIIRTAVAAGVSAIFLTKGCVDPYNDKTVRSTMSSITKIPLYEGLSDEDVKTLFTKHDFISYATAVTDNTVDYRQMMYEFPALLIVGNEGNGISSHIMNLAQHVIHIPMYGPIESLNVAVATALCLYKIRENMPED